MEGQGKAAAPVLRSGVEQQACSHASCSLVGRFASLAWILHPAFPLWTVAAYPGGPPPFIFSGLRVPVPHCSCGVWSKSSAVPEPAGP